MKIVGRYLSRELISSILFIMLALLAMFSFFDLIQELEDFGKGTYGMGKMLLFVLLKAPGHVYEVVPLAVLIGTLYALAQLARFSELVILRVSGISMFSMGMVLLRVGMLFTIMTFLVGELVAPLSERSAQRMRIHATDSLVAQDFRSGLWAKDGDSFVNIEDVLPDSELLNVHIYEFDPEFHLRMITNAKGGKFTKGRWDLHDVTQTRFSGQKISTQTFPQAYWDSAIRPELLNVLLVVPEKMSAWNLYSYINHLRVNHQKTTRHQIALWAKMAYPVACIVMVVLALPFGFLQQRSGGVSSRIFLGIMVGISYQVLNRLFVHIGLLNDWPPILSATIPTLMFLAVGVGMVLWVERR
ncbi:MAG TPA: LPS export ABC transporter permease LptG [Methylophilaceae bacterium]|nr:LPS export ABC transporter permease LptG [Methylophilaceae bacterium]